MSSSCIYQTASLMLGVRGQNRQTVVGAEFLSWKWRRSLKELAAAVEEHACLCRQQQETTSATPVSQVQETEAAVTPHPNRRRRLQKTAGSAESPLRACGWKEGGIRDPLCLQSTVEATHSALNVEAFLGTLWSSSAAITGSTSVCTVTVHHFMTTMSHLLPATHDNAPHCRAAAESNSYLELAQNQEPSASAWYDPVYMDQRSERGFYHRVILCHEEHSRCRWQLWFRQQV